MARPFDYAQLRDQTLDSGQDEEAVTVNTRALIDKVLARYSGEWTTFRELIQNAADASAKKVTIKFETKPSSSVPTPQSNDHSNQIKHVLLHHTLQRLLVTNDGQPFTENDWSRLKRIAEGNPDETKIGAFGVGFYSVFAECEAPFVSSGKETMAFYWKGNSLFTRKGVLPTGYPPGDTCFVLDYRSGSTPVPNLMSICQFLSTSLTFVGLESIELWLDDWNIFTLTKRSSDAMAVSIPKDLDTKTKEAMLRITGVDSQESQINAKWMNVVGFTPSAADRTVPQSEGEGHSAPSLRSFFSRLAGSSQTPAAKKAAKEEEAAQKAIAQDLTGISQATVFIRVNTVNVRSSVTGTFATELERATKKKPPKETKIAILTSSYNETSASLSSLRGTSSSRAAEIVTSILPTKSGRIFIGFPTAQTTGLLAHISAPSLIPTVERENIDLNARYVRTWNTELLSVAGIACRIAYAGEMAGLRSRIESGAITESQMDSLLPAAIHSLKQFTFRDSTPIAKAGQIIEQSFWTCGKSKKPSIEILSSRGILSSQDVRIASEDLSFVKGIPVVPEELIKQALEFMEKLSEFGFISAITTSDIKTELEKQAISEEQLQEFLKWAAHKLKTKQLDASAVQSLFASTIANIGQEEGPTPKNKILVLRDVQSFINSTRINATLPAPDYVVPFRFTKGLNSSEMQAFGWEELQIIPWLRWLIEQAVNKGLPSDQNMMVSPDFAAQVLAVLSKGWDTLSQSSKGTIVELLSVRTVIPTKLGMRLPPDSYFATVKLFDDLPVVISLSNVKEKFLRALGVRKTIELAVIFKRLMANSFTDNDAKVGWSHVDLVKYLVSVWSDIPDEDIAQLRETPLCPAENSEGSQPTKQYYKVSDLFEPNDFLRALGLPMLQWPGQFNAFTPEGKFLKLLGLRQYPTVPELVEILRKASVASNNALYEIGMKYFIENHYHNNYASFNIGALQVPFLPVASGKETRFVKPADCFVESRASVFGYDILRQDLKPHATKLGVREHPPMVDCAHRLIVQPPQDRPSARELFGYMGARLPEISGPVAEQLGKARIVPITRTTDEKEISVNMVTPLSCFLGDGQEYGEIFDYVDFGEQQNLFLLKVGCKHEPSIVELTQLVLKTPGKILKTLKIEKYLNLLRKLHLNMATLKKDKILWKDMKITPFLLAFKEFPKVQKDARDEADFLDDDPEPTVKEYHLRAAGGIVINDDILEFNIFKQHVLAAPTEEPLEELYAHLGTPFLSSIIDEEPRLGTVLKDQQAAGNLRALILERARLFLHEQNPNNVKHDAKWLDKNLEVQVVQGVSLRRTLRGRNITHEEKRTAQLTARSKNGCMLSITTTFDVWQVSQEITGVILEKAKSSSLMMMETFLTTNLYKLRARGYNVDRILRKRAADEARVAESERQKQVEVENRRREERAGVKPSQQTSSQESHQEIQRTPQKDPSIGSPQQLLQMPGGFQESPSPDRPQMPSGELSRPDTPSGPLQRLRKHLTKQLGFDDGPDMSSHSTTNDLPPPYEPQGPRGPGGQEVTVSPESVHQNLQSAITSTRAYGSNTLVSRPETSVIKEVSSYCDERPSHNLKFLSNSTSGIKLFIATTNPSTANAQEFLTANSAGLDTFAEVIMDCGSVFKLSTKTLHVFYDESSKTIAFNSNGSLFFNYRYFAQLHLKGMASPQVRSQAMVYWWVTLCHELAHNLVSDHSAAHSYYMESFVSEYFPIAAARFAEVAARS